jgi:hypothetical protein
MLFQNWDFFRIEDLDLHNLAVKKVSSLLLIPLEYFLSNYLQIDTCGITTAFKVKGSVLLMNMNSGFDRNGCYPRMVGSGTMVRVWWRSHCNWKVHLGLITNVASDSSAINNGQP